MSLGEAAYREMRTWIAEGTLSPGAGLREVDLARRLKTSRTPVREALRRLHAEGLLVRNPRGGYSLFEFTRDDLAKVYAVRETLEALAVRLAAKHRNRAQLGKLADTLEALDAAVRREDARELERLALEFHDTIAEASGNWYLKDVLGNLRVILARHRPRTRRYTVLRAEIHAEHHALFEALNARDANACEKLMRAHNAHALAARLDELPADGAKARGPKRRSA